MDFYGWNRMPRSSSIASVAGAAVLCLAGSFLVHAQSPSGEGGVVGRVSGKGGFASGVTITLSGRFDLRTIRVMDPSGGFAISGIVPGNYTVKAASDGYCPNVVYVSVRGGDPTPVMIELIPPGPDGSCEPQGRVDPKRAVGIQAPPFQALRQNLQDLLNRSNVGGRSGIGLYNSLNDPVKASLLNVYAKMSATMLPQWTAFNYVRRVLALADSGAVFEMDPAIRDQLNRAGAQGRFRPVPLTLVKSPTCDPTGSFKSQDKVAVLHITLCGSPAESQTAEVHIDSGSGISESFRVIGRVLSGSPQSPYAIHNLLEDVNIPTGYRLRISP
jgi:hypothetical protein